MQRSLFAIVVSILILTSGAPVRTAAADTAGPGKASTPSLKLLKTLRLGGEGRWDYLCVDAAARRLYVPRSTHVQVVDLEKGSLLGDIPDTNGVHGVALCLEQNLGFASSGRDNAVTVFDLKTLKVTKTVKAGRNPDAILFDPLTKHIFAFNHSGGSVTVIDPSALDKEPVTIEVGGTLEFGVSDEAGHVFVNVENKSEIVEIDSKANRVLAHWSIAPGDAPTGLAIDLAHHRLFAGCGNQKMIVLDSESGKVLAAVEIGKGVDGVAYEPTLGVAISANGRDGTVSIVKETAPGKFEAIDTPKTVSGAKTIAVDSMLHQALLPCNVPNEKGEKVFGIAVVGPEEKSK